MADNKKSVQNFVKRFSVKKYLIPDDPHCMWETWAIEKTDNKTGEVTTTYEDHTAGMFNRYHGKKK